MEDARSSFKVASIDWNLHGRRSPADQATNSALLLAHKQRLQASVERRKQLIDLLTIAVQV